MGENNDAQSPVGFVGLGAMGGRMAARLLGAGRSLVVCDPDPTAVSAASEAGATVAATPREVADAAPVVMVSLPRPDVVREVALGADGLRGGSAIEVYVDLSTTGVAVAPGGGGRPGRVRCEPGRRAGQRRPRGGGGGTADPHDVRGFGRGGACQDAR